MPDGSLIACTRMYNATERVTEAWACIARATAELAGVALRFETFPYPADILDVWRRPDLGLVMICGRIFMLEGQRHIPLAAPCRSFGGKPQYHTKLLVRKDSPFRTFEDSFGARLGWTVEHSHSGYLAVERFLAPYQGKVPTPLYPVRVGPLHTPANCLNALAENTADIVPLDGYYHELLEKNAPEKLAATRVLAITGEYPMPFFAASAKTPSDVCGRLSAALLELGNRESLRPALGTLCLDGFCRPDFAAYSVLRG